MERPDVEGIARRSKRGTGYRKMQDTTLTLIAFIYQLEETTSEIMFDYQSLGEDFANLDDELDDLEADLASALLENEELKEIAEEFIERRDKGLIRSTYTYNRFKKALGK